MAPAVGWSILLTVPVDISRERGFAWVLSSESAKNIHILSFAVVEKNNT